MNEGGDDGSARVSVLLFFFAVRDTRAHFFPGGEREKAQVARPLSTLSLVARAVARSGAAQRAPPLTPSSRPPSHGRLMVHPVGRLVRPGRRVHPGRRRGAADVDGCECDRERGAGAERGQRRGNSHATHMPSLFVSLSSRMTTTRCRTTCAPMGRTSRCEKRERKREKGKRQSTLAARISSLSLFRHTLPAPPRTRTLTPPHAFTGHPLGPHAATTRHVPGM